MKVHHDIAHEGTLGDEGRTAMRFDENSIAHLMSILIDLYSDKELAVIREYSTNAFDAHVAAGHSDPIEVFSPSSLSPMFVVKDHGPGLSAQDIRDNLAKYGWSSKRDSDEAVGMLGLGSKSGLTYTSQFTYIAVKDGVQAVVMVTRESDGGGVVQVVSEEPTDKPNGVEVHIPVGDPASFRLKMKQFYRFWAPGSVLVDGKEPGLIGRGDLAHSDDIWLDDGVLLTRTVSTTQIVMGNVAYPAPKAPTAIQNNGRTWHVVAWVPIGSVNFTPSREALQDTKRTLDCLDELKEYVSVTLRRRAQALIEACPDHKAALHLVRNMPYVPPNPTYKGDPVPIKGRVKVPEGTRSINRKDEWSSDRAVSIESVQHDYATDEYAVVITGVPKERRLDADIKWKARRLVEERKLGMRYDTKADGTKVLANIARSILFTPSVAHIGDPWLSLPHVPFEEVNAFQRLRDKSKTRVPEGEGYFVLSSYRGDMPRRVAWDDFEPDAYVTWSEATKDRFGAVLAHARTLMAAGFQVAAVYAKHQSWFNEKYAGTPHVEAFVDVARHKLDEYFARFEPDKSRILDVDCPERHRFNRNCQCWRVQNKIRRIGMHEAESKYGPPTKLIAVHDGFRKSMPLTSIMDPELREVMVMHHDVLIHQRRRPDAVSREDIARLCNGLGIPTPQLPQDPVYVDLHDRLARLGKRYPLFDDANNTETLVNYVNAMYIVAEQLHLVAVA